jgi:hypothetical protein
MMIVRNTKLNQLALAELQEDGEEIPEEADLLADLESDEAELQKAIEMSKALMDTSSNTPADEAMALKQAKLESELVEKKKEKAEKLSNSQFPDIFSKPNTS